MKIVKKDDVNGDELRAACGVMRALVLDDDLRHEYGKAHEHAAQIARSSLEILTLLLSSKYFLSKLIIYAIKTSS